MVPKIFKSLKFDCKYVCDFMIKACSLKIKQTTLRRYYLNLFRVSVHKLFCRVNTPVKFIIETAEIFNKKKTFKIALLFIIMLVEISIIRTLDTRVMQKVLSLIGFFSFILGKF